VLLLPLFFVYTGLRTEIGLLNDVSLWKVAGIVILVAVAGKFLGSALAARITGQSWKNSLLIGSLMNTRGLIELVALNIGYDIGILSPEIFTILVLMALVTTFMTGPLMELINWLFRSGESLASVSGLFKVLISFGPPASGIRLLTLVAQLFSKDKNQMSINALHLTPDTEISKDSAAQFEEEAFRNILKIAEMEGLNVTTEYRTSELVQQEITRTANRGKYNLLVVGSSRPLLSSDKTGGKARYFFEKVKSDVALVIDNGFKEIKRVLIICMDNESNQYLQMVATRFNDEIEVDNHCLSDNPEPPADYTDYDLIITGVECYRTNRQAGVAWTLGPVSIVIFSQYGE
jgi:nucleotide-binding universal stress UspA family protein